MNNDLINEAERSMDSFPGKQRIIIQAPPAPSSQGVVVAVKD